MAAIAAAGEAGLLRTGRGADRRADSSRLLEPNDVVTVFSNGGFDGIHEKLLSALRELTGSTLTTCDRARCASLPAACGRAG